MNSRSQAYRTSRRPTRRRATSTRSYPARRVRAIANRADEARIKRIEGRWQSFIVTESVTSQTTGSQKFIELKRPNTMTVGSTRLQARKMTIYALNSMIAVSATGGYKTSSPIIGAMAATVLKADEDLNLWPHLMNPSSASGGEGQDPQYADNVRPWRWFQPFVIDLGEGSPRRTQAFPYTLRRGRQIMLGTTYNPANLSNEEYGIMFYLRGEAGIEIAVKWWGRYRFIERAAT